MIKQKPGVDIPQAKEIKLQPRQQLTSFKKKKRGKKKKNPYGQNPVGKRLEEKNCT